MFLVTELIALLGTNLILMQALGTSTLFIAAANRKNLVGTALIITVFTTLGSSAAYLIDSVLPENGEMFRLMCYVLAVSVIYVLLLVMLYVLNRSRFERYKKYIHLSAFNCAVMGTVFTISGNASADDYSIIDYASAGLQAGIGFIIAAFILTAAYRRLNSAEVPDSFRGLPAMLVYLGIISMAVYALI